VKEKLDIAFIGGDSAGALINEMFQDGLPSHPRVNKVDFEAVFSRWGEMPFQPTPIKDILDNITSYDLIFVNSDEVASKYESIIEGNKLWDRVVLYDCKDCQSVQKAYLNKPIVYFKRSWERTPHEWIPEGSDKVVPLAYAILNEYYDVIPLDFYQKFHHPIFSPKGRDIPVICTLPQCYRGVPRDKLVHAVKNYEWGLNNQSHNMQLTLIYTGGWILSSLAVLFRQPRILDYPQINWWYIYMHLLRRSQIIFTAHSHSATGDIRTWEAFSSGALVFIDEIDIPTNNPFEEGKHFIKIDINNLPKTFARAQELLSDQPERERIAQAGFEHGQKFHTPRARMDYVFEEIDKRKKWD
jgi:hypothetical protein